MNKLTIEALEHAMYELCRSDRDFMKRGVGFMKFRIHDSPRTGPHVKPGRAPVTEISRHSRGLGVDC
jgi:hypothetical protein